MVAGFRRSISLPGPNPNSMASIPTPKGRAAKEKSYHVRSTSLPCRSHPLVSHLEDDLRALRAWQSQPGLGSAWLCSGLTSLDVLQTSLADLLNLPQSGESLRRSSNWAELLLDDSLSLTDAYGAFRFALVAAKEHSSEAQIAVRRSDEARLASSLRSLKRTEKELVKLASEVRDMTRSSAVLGCMSDATEAEIAGIAREVTVVTATATAAVFSEIAAASSAASVAASSLVQRDSLKVSPLKWLTSSKRKGVEDKEALRRAVLERMEGLGECLGALEGGSERVFRSLVNIRVSLLNILTPPL